MGYGLYRVFFGMELEDWHFNHVNPKMYKLFLAMVLARQNDLLLVTRGPSHLVGVATTISFIDS